MSERGLVVIGSTGGGVLSRLVRHDWVRALIREVVADRECGFLDVARDAGIAAVRLDSTDGLAFSNALRERYRDEPRLVFLSFYTRLFRGEFVRETRGRLFNCHPSILPACKGLRGFEETLTSGALFMGSTLHVVDDRMDNGASAIQAAIPLNRSRSIAENRHRVFLSQYYGAAQFLRWLRDGRLTLPADGEVRVAGAMFLPSVFSPNLDPDFFQFLGEPDELREPKDGQP